MKSTASWIRALALSFLAITLRGKISHSFTNELPTQRCRKRAIRSHPILCRMVRNIDMVEALIFYGTSSIYEDNDERIFLPGVEDLIDECKRDDTSVIAILDKNEGVSENEDIAFRVETSPAPNPRDLWEAIHSIEIQPKGFGGSSGFGRKAADPERSPLPAHCVVLCDTVEKCRAARFAGMRVLCLTNNDLADAVMNYDRDSGDTADLDYYWESITMDDIATPGSFWLNPPLPKDDEGNRVNVISIIKSYENTEDDTTTDAPDIHNPDDDDDDLLASILNDMDPL